MSSGDAAGPGHGWRAPFQLPNKGPKRWRGTVTQTADATATGQYRGDIVATGDALQICALGPLELREGARPVRLGGRQRTLLAVLVVHAGDTVSSDRLLEEIWSGHPPRSGAATLQVHMSRLRRSLSAEVAGGPHIVTRPPGYVLDVPPDCFDVARFQALVAEGREALDTGRARAASGTFERALALWRGAPLGDLGHEPFAVAWVSRLAQLHRGAVCDRIDAVLAQGRHRELLGELEALSLDNPMDERVYTQLMVALYRSGRQAEALRACQTLRRALAAELGIEPGAEVRRLEEAVLRQDADLEAVHANLAPPPGGATTGPAVAPGRSGVADDPFVGRQRELEMLHAAFTRAVSGHGAVVLMGGEPGVGKTRLVEEFTATAVASGARVAWGRCYEGDGAASFWPWAQVLRAYVQIATDDEIAETLGPWRAELANVLPELGGEPSTAAGTNPDATRFRLFDNIATSIARASERAPSVIVLDDVHWADTASLLLLEFISRTLTDVPALVVAVYRAHDATGDGPLAATLGVLARGPVSRVAVEGLGEPDVARYLELTTGVVSPSAAKEVRRRTGGNAFFVREMVSFLAAEGRLEGGSSVEGLNQAIPVGVRDVVRRRCRGLSKDAYRVLTVAAVAGSAIRVDVLERTCKPIDLVDAVEELLAAGLVQDNDATPGELRFPHDLVREAIYGELSALRRARLHGEVAAALEVLQDAHNPPPLAEVARHLHLAVPAGVDVAKTIEFDVRAAEAATRVLGYEDAAAHYRRALATVGDRDMVQRGELLLALGDACWRAGESAHARETFLETADVGRAVGDATLVGRAVLGFGGGLFRDWHTSRGENNEKLVLLLEDAIDGLGNDDDALRVRLLGHLAEELYYASPADRRLSLSAEALALAERLGDPRIVASALCSRCLAVWSPDHLAERLRLSARIVELGHRLDDPEVWMFGQHYLTLAQFESGDVEAARRGLDAYQHRADASRQPLFAWRAQVMRALEALLDARFRDAERLAEEALRMGEQAQEPDALNIYAVQIGIVRMEEDRLDELRPVLAELVEQLPETPWWDAALAFVDAATGSLDEARERFERLAAESFGGLATDFAWSVGMALLALVSADLGDVRRAAALHRLLEPYAASNAMAASRGAWGSVSMYLGILATTTGDYQRADQWFEQALAANARMVAPSWMAHTRYHHARMLIARDGSGDRAAALRLLDDAAHSAKELGMIRLTRLIAEAREGASG